MAEISLDQVIEMEPVFVIHSGGVDSIFEEIVTLDKLDINTKGLQPSVDMVSMQTKEDIQPKPKSNIEDLEPIIFPSSQVGTSIKNVPEFSQFKLPGEIEFYDVKKQYDYSYLSKEQLLLLANASEYIVISGCQINPGLPFWNEQDEKKSFFTLKVEGDLNSLNILSQEDDTSTELQDQTSSNEVQLRKSTSTKTQVNLPNEKYPQMLYGSPCPPYWKPTSDTLHALGKSASDVTPQELFNITKSISNFLHERKAPQG